MSFLDRFFNKSLQIPPNFEKAWSSFSSLLGENGAEISPNNAKYITTVFTCNKILSETLTTFKVNVLKSEMKGKREIRKKANHPLNRILSLQPNPFISANTWFKMIMSDLNYRGTHYSQIIKNQRGEVVAIYPLFHDNMSVEVEEGKVIYKYTTPTKQVIIPPKNVLKIINIPDESGVVGISPIEANRRLLQFSVNSDEYGSNFYKNGANPSGVFYKDDFLSDEAFKRLQKSLSESYTGLKNLGKPMILEDGLKYQQMSLTNSDAQYLETKKFQKSEIASIFRVPMHLVNSLENATFTNIEHQSLEFIKYTMLPIVRNISQQLLIQLFDQSDWDRYEIDFNIDTLLKGDYKTRTEGYKTMLQNGIMSINEIRELENLNFIEDGDKHYIQLNMTTLERLERQIKIKVENETTN